MTRWFNTAGPCQADIHYMLPALERLPSVERLILQRGYFVIHAPRQTGKTTAMLALAQQLTVQGKYAAVMVSAETGARVCAVVQERRRRCHIGNWSLDLLI